MPSRQFTTRFPVGHSAAGEEWEEEEKQHEPQQANEIGKRTKDVRKSEQRRRRWWWRWRWRWRWWWWWCTIVTMTMMMTMLYHCHVLREYRERQRGRNVLWCMVRNLIVRLSSVCLLNCVWVAESMRKEWNMNYEKAFRAFPSLDIGHNTASDTKWGG